MNSLPKRIPRSHLPQPGPAPEGGWLERACSGRPRTSISPSLAICTAVRYPEDERGVPGFSECSTVFVSSRSDASQRFVMPQAERSPAPCTT